MRLGQDDVDVVTRGADGDPAEPVGRDVVADLEAERVAVEAERGLGVGRTVRREDGRMDAGGDDAADPFERDGRAVCPAASIMGR